jgi:endo-1,4-beta-D-glucanase Y
LVGDPSRRPPSVAPSGHRLRTVSAAATTLALGLSTACASRPVRPPEESFLRSAWQQYRAGYIHGSGYVLDRTRNGGEVTSEGQSYALLRAAWMDDRVSFDRVLAWTDSHLRRPDGLYAWLWTPAGGGRVLDEGSATDADQDVAFALIVAAHRFRHPAYLVRARELLRSIRRVASVPIGAHWFPAAGNWAVTERIVNLSYFLPYAYPYFDLVDPESGWLDAIPIGYRLLAAVTTPPARMPPDFMSLDEAGNPAPLPAHSRLSRQFSFDAIRISWRVALDCRLHRRPAACASPGAEPLVEALRAGRIVTAYEPTGAPASQQESTTFYAALLPLLEERDPPLADQLKRTRLSPQALGPILGTLDRYYDLNWIWFGLGFSSGLVPGRTPAVDEVRRLLNEAPP